MALNRAEDFERARDAVHEHEGAMSYRSGHHPRAYWTEAKRRGWTKEKQRQEEPQ